MLLLSGCRSQELPQYAQSEKGKPRATSEDISANSKGLGKGEKVASGHYASIPGFQQIFADVAEKAVPAVVSVRSEKEAPMGQGSDSEAESNSPFHWFFTPKGRDGASGNRHRESGLGSGVIISQDGFMLTNNHVIDGADVIRVTTSDDQEWSAKLVGADQASDVAVLKIQAKGPFPAMPMGNSDKLRIGEWILAVGNPYGLSQTVTAGIISAKGRSNTGINSYENFLQTDAAINPGNSGGALMNLDGELIGINTAIFTKSGGYQGIGFAIPINMARKIMEDLIRDGEVTRGWLGVSIQPIDPGLAEALGLKESRGALVGGVVEGSPAEKAGLKRGDVLLSMDGKALRDHSDLLNRIAMVSPGTWIVMDLRRSGKDMTLRLQVAKRDEKRLTTMNDNTPDGQGAEKLGIDIAPVSQLMRERYRLGASIKRGVVITDIESGSRAATGRLREGDVILEVNRLRVTDPLQFEDLLKRAMKGNRILFLIGRDGETFYTAI